MKSRSDTIIELIKSERTKRGMSSNHLARLAGCSGRAILYWESGEREISLEMADRLLKALKLRVAIGMEESL